MYEWGLHRTCIAVAAIGLAAVAPAAAGTRWYWSERTAESQAKSLGRVRYHEIIYSARCYGKGRPAFSRRYPGLPLFHTFRCSFVAGRFCPDERSYRFVGTLTVLRSATDPVHVPRATITGPAAPVAKTRDPNC